MRKTLTATAAAISVVVSMMSMSQAVQAADPQTLNVWTVDEPNPFTEKMANEFAKQHPDVKVQIRRADTDFYKFGYIKIARFDGLALAFSGRQL